MTGYAVAHRHDPDDGDDETLETEFLAALDECSPPDAADSADASDRLAALYAAAQRRADARRTSRLASAEREMRRRIERHAATQREIARRPACLRGGEDCQDG